MIERNYPHFLQEGRDHMEDHRIVEMYWQRNEQAIAETETRYGKYLKSISYQILHNSEDAEECVNDTYSAAWQSIPPHRPAALSTYLGKIIRRISIDRWRKYSAEKRGKGEAALALSELEECVSGSGNVETEVERQELQRNLNEFLRKLPADERGVFMRRYWYMDSIAEISEKYGFSESKIKSMLLRTRKKLCKLLEKEGY